MAKSIRDIWEQQKKIHEKTRFYGTAVVGAKGQVVIPANARKDFGYASGTQLIVFGNTMSKMMVIGKTDRLEALFAHMMKQLSGTGLEKDVERRFKKIFGQIPSKTSRAKK